MPADPTYPLYPVLAIILTILLLLVLVNNVARQSWNLGVCLLCFLLIIDNLTGSINSIIWKDNADIKAVVWCDIVTHLQIFTFVAKPACTLVITYRLYKIASFRSVEAASRLQRRKEAWIEFAIVLGPPTLVTGILYYIVQNARFAVIEGLGCRKSTEASVVEILLVRQWAVALPLISILFYCPRILWTFSRHSRETDCFLKSNGSVTRVHYFRILALDVVDVILTLPFGALDIAQELQGFAEDTTRPLPFYGGWTQIHTAWSPISVSYTELQREGSWPLFRNYLAKWSPVFMSLAIFALFGLTADARGMYWRAFWATARCVSWTPHVREVPSAVGSSMILGVREMNDDHYEGTHPSFIISIHREGGTVATTDVPEGEKSRETDSPSLYSEESADGDAIIFGLHYAGQEVALAKNDFVSDGPTAASVLRGKATDGHHSYGYNY